MNEYQGLRALELAELLSIDCNRVCDTFPAHQQNRLAEQIRRAAESAALNISEGASRSSFKEYLHHLDYARSSLKEVQTGLRIAHGSGYIDDATYARLEALRDEASRTLYGLMRAVQKRIENGERKRRIV